MKKLIFTGLLILSSAGCIPNSPYMLWHEVGVSDVDTEHAHQGAQDTDEAWCAVPAFQGGDGAIHSTTVADAKTRPYVCYPTEGQAEQAWQRDRDTWMDWINTQP